MQYLPIFFLLFASCSTAFAIPDILPEATQETTEGLVIDNFVSYASDTREVDASPKWDILPYFGLVPGNIRTYQDNHNRSERAEIGNYVDFHGVQAVPERWIVEGAQNPYEVTYFTTDEQSVCYIGSYDDGLHGDADLPGDSILNPPACLPRFMAIGDSFTVQTTITGPDGGTRQETFSWTLQGPVVLTVPTGTYRDVLHLDGWMASGIGAIKYEDSNAGWYEVLTNFKPGNGFADVPPTSWAYSYIHAIRDADITGGCGNGNYCPQGLVTREQMAAFLVRAVEGEPATNYCGGSSYFSDVAPDAWSCGYIKRLSELNITGGCGGGNYCPQGLVTRDQMAAFIVRAVAGEPALDYCGDVAPFQDVAPSSFFCRYIKRLAELNVTQGCGDGNYCPYDTVNREQMAAFLARAFLDMD